MKVGWRSDPFHIRLSSLTFRCSHFPLGSHGSYGSQCSLNFYGSHHVSSHLPDLIQIALVNLLSRAKRFGCLERVLRNQPNVKHEKTSRLENILKRSSCYSFRLLKTYPTHASFLQDQLLKAPARTSQGSSTRNLMKTVLHLLRLHLLLGGLGFFCALILLREVLSPTEG